MLESILHDAGSCGIAGVEAATKTHLLLNM